MGRAATGPGTSKPSVADAYGHAWSALRAYVSLLVLVWLATLVLNGPSNLFRLGDWFDIPLGGQVGLLAFGVAYSFLVGVPLNYGNAYVNLGVSRGSDPTLSDLFEGFRNYGAVLGSALLAGLIVFLGLLLFVIPGVWFGLRLSLTPFAVVDRGLGPLEAVKESWSRTRGHALRILAYVVVSFFVLVGGLLLLVVGLIPASMLAGIALAKLYDDMGPARGPAEAEPARFPAAARYEPRRRLGGGAGAVQARDTAADRDVVLKPVPGVGLDELRRRLGVGVAGLDHANLVPVHEVAEVRGTPTVVREHVSGASLAEILDRGPLPPRRALRLGLEILEGLDRLHEAALVHGALSPGNVLLAEGGGLALADYGLPREPEGAYLAPEQALDRAVDARADLYALAAILYEALTGRFYLGREPDAIPNLRSAIARERPALPADELPRKANLFLAKGLRKDPDDRFGSAGEMGRALRILLREGES